MTYDFVPAVGNVTCYIISINNTTTTKKRMSIMSKATISYYSYLVVKSVVVGILVSLFVVFA